MTRKWLADADVPTDRDSDDVDHNDNFCVYVSIMCTYFVDDHRIFCIAAADCEDNCVDNDHLASVSFHLFT